MSRSPDWIPHSRPTLRAGDAEAAARAVSSGYVGSGPLVSEFEAKVAARIGRQHARATTTGSAALHLALLSAGVRSGDAVLIPAFVCRAVLNSVLLAGGKPVLVDVDPDTLCVNRETIARALSDVKSKRTVLVLVHSFGYVADVKPLQDLNVTIVEDAASSFGAKRDGAHAGSLGSVSVLSFASTKMMTTGQGGMVLTGNAGDDKRIGDLMDYDCTVPPAEGEQKVAFNYGFTDPQAALGLSQLASLDEFVARRGVIAQNYDSALDGVRGVTLPASHAGRAYYRYVFRHEAAPAIVERIMAAGVDARGSVAHFLEDYVRTGKDFSGCAAIRDKIVSLPIYPSLTDEQVARVARVTREALQASP